MTNRIAKTSPLIYARVAGFVYLITIITNILAVVFLDSKLLVPGNAAATFNNIMANQLLFRVGIAYNLIMFASVVLLSWALYVILKTVNKNLALLALLWRLVEAAVGCLMVLSSLIVLLLLNGEIYSAVFETEQLQALVGLLVGVSSAALSILFVFLSLGTIVFCYLFFKSRYIPRILSAFGIFSFLLALIGTFVSILIPNIAVMVFAAPAGLFELVIGLWLLLKGVNVEQWEQRALKSA